MNYEEALIKKKATVKEFEKKGQSASVHIIIVPQATDDQEKFMKCYDKHHYQDGLCKLFSTNNMFTVLVMY
ncbi:hypothetical protein [Chryseobacterium sp.]|uniref:hypothetical protein n=1 Tax=Chryseobacterium sp. TaxID=1871047 RepID=UPI0025BC6C36|nr:hypothetical protein [Chryseobacterium sp.]MBV8327297.1 hypothetical protein [Chryseobacterium sp.]